MNTLNFLEDVVDEFKERIREELDELDPQEIAHSREYFDTTHEFCDELGIDVYDIMHEVADIMYLFIILIYFNWQLSIKT